jgi:hypothetical protein
MKRVEACTIAPKMSNDLVWRCEHRSMIAVSEPITTSAVLWQHVPLLPGLELRIRNDAGPVIHRLAREIAKQYASANAAAAPTVA